jgi:hypothetical protein
MESVTDQLQEYKDGMDMPVECLAVAMWGVEGNGKRMEDFEIIEAATRNIEVLKEMVLALGFQESLLKIIMRN